MQKNAFSSFFRFFCFNITLLIFFVALLNYHLLFLKIQWGYMNMSMKVSTIAEKINYPRKQVRFFFCNVRNFHTPGNHKESILLFIFTS